VISHLRSNAVGYLALFVALSGSSYAAVALPRNSVGPVQLKSNAVTSAKVKDRSLLSKDFKAGQLPAGPKGDSGATGSTGAMGAAGTAGPAGSNGAPGADGATGSQGPPGPQGLQGPAGSGGAVFLGQDLQGLATVPAMPDGQQVASATVMLPAAGRMYVYGHGQMTGYCDTGNVRLLVHVDGTGLAGTARIGSGTAPSPGVSLSPAGVTAGLTAGAHTVALRARCLSGNAVMSPSGEYSVGAFMLAG